MLVLAVLFCLPLFILFSVALKSPEDLFTDALSFPTDPHFGNFSTAWESNTGRAGGLRTGARERTRADARHIARRLPSDDGRSLQQRCPPGASRADSTSN